MTASPMTVAMPSDREIAVTRVFDAPRTRIFECWTTPDLVKQWLTGPPGWSFETCTVDLQPRGQYRFVWKDQNGNTLGLTGMFLSIVPPGRLVSTEKFDQDWTGGETRVTTVFAETDGRTTLQQTIQFSSQAARDAAASGGMTQGMEMGFERLAQFLAGQSS